MSASRSYPQRLLFPRQAAPRPLRLSLRTRSTPGRLRLAGRVPADCKRPRREAAGPVVKRADLYRSA